MKDNLPYNVASVSYSDARERRELLARRLEISADRICDLQDRLMNGISTLKPIEYDRLLDEFRAEQLRYDRIDRELQGMETPAKLAEAKERWRKQNDSRRKKLRY